MLLTREGFDVLLLDRATFPRDKPCGEFITPGCVPILRSLGVWNDLLTLGLHPIPSAVLHAPGGDSAQYSPADGPAGWSMRRTELDAALVRYSKDAGAEVREGVAVRSLIRENGAVKGVEVREGDSDSAIRCRLVIGADGAHSLVARELGLVRPIRRLQRLAVVSHWRGIGGEAIEMRSRRDSVCGFGPLSADSTNISIVVRTEEAASLAGRAREFLEETIAARFPDLHGSLESAELEDAVRTVGCFGHTTRSSTTNGAMLVGDAACFIDPFTGEGIYFALRGAELAASIAADALRSNDTSLSRLAEYEPLRIELRNRYRLCDVVQAVVRTPALMNRAVAAMNRNPNITDSLMGVLGDIRPAADALDPRLIAGLLAPA